ncbi:MAG: T9SS type B sorting domain-containing protein [Chitinophagaceae bacterium]|nr:T9SS type B sorting domain-containing protein [Chitinophagaceae bacterium]
MKKHCFGKLSKFLLVILISFSSLLAASQSFYNTTNWRFSNPQKFGFNVIDLDFFDNNNGIAVGASGGIAYTKNGGTTWSYGNFSFMNAVGLQTSTSFQDVHFVSSSIAYAVGSGGCMAKTTDGGATWSRVITPLFANAKNINTAWFVNDNKGYIGGEWNTLDSIPKVYFTNDGGATWDSLVSPSGGTITRIGYINNPNVAPQLYTVTGKGKEIQRIMFFDDNTGYITGNSQHSSGGPTIQIPAVNAATCLPTGGQTSALGAQHASMVWKFSNGTLTDYSITKERLGFSGNTVTPPVPCSGSAGLYRTVTAATQSYRAMLILDQTTILLISNTNNTAIRIYTGANDVTLNMANGLNERGRYQLVNLTNPPTGFPTIPAVNPIFTFLNPSNIIRAANGKIFVPVLSPALNPVNRMMTSVDNGTTWVEERWLPTGRNYSAFGGQAMDILPSGKFVAAGQNGVVADSIPGGVWSSTYVQGTTGAFNKIDFADCNNAIAAGGGTIARTNDGGKTWDQIVRQDFINLNISINSAAYATNNPAKAYFATSVGNIYRTTDMNVAQPALPTIDPVFSNGNEQMFDVAAIGNDSVWVCGYSGFSVPAANRSPKIFRSTNGGTTWTTFNGFHTGTNFQNFRHIEFPTRLVGYVCGTRDTIWKTSDGGATWSKLPLPTPGVTPQITYNDMFALNVNTVFLVGNGFPRKVVFRTTDGGNTWQDITGNILSIFPVGNFNSVVFHDLNNGYIGCAGGFLVTNNGGATWRIDVPPSPTNHTSLSFAPKNVPAGTPAANRRLFSVGVFSNHILEYGDTTLLNVSTSESIVSSCDNATQGVITITATGGIAPYTYSINGGPFQSSNTFSNLAPGPKTISIKDAACGIVTKAVTVPVKPSPAVNAGQDQTIVEGDNVNLSGSSTGTPATIAWTPVTTITSGATTFTPVAKPPVTATYTMTVTDVNGCISSDNVIVTVLPYCLKVMDAFTPNSDGMNDRWVVTNNGGLCVKQVYVTVFNRYGNIVYKNDNYANNWEGTYNGKPVADGTYYYVVNYLLMNGAYVTLKGDVTILR